MLFIQDLLDAKRRLANAILMEGQNVAKHVFRASFDASEALARALTSVVNSSIHSQDERSHVCLGHLGYLFLMLRLMSHSISAQIISRWL